MRRIAIAMVVSLAGGALSAAPASAEVGGMGAKPSKKQTSAASGRALLLGGRARPPITAPAAVGEAIRAANRIAAKPYLWGGGHGSWWDRGYDCSGAVSYALHGGGMLHRALDSGSLARWGAPGPGRWISVYANAGHAYAVIAGLRFDTSGGPGPRWHRQPRGPAGFAVRHPVGY
jgi:hypothetical protein